MREIKFRAWDKEFKEFCYPRFGDRIMPSNWEDIYILNQFTGLLDKSGKEIYEGDILAPMDNDFRPQYMGNWTVVFDGGTFAAEGGSHRISTWIPYWVPEKQIEVIGNIYQNKDLLK